MTSLAIQRLESLLQTRQLDNTLTTRRLSLDVRQLPTGITAIDGPLGGGWPHGEVSELVGGRSSGRGAVLLATLAAATRMGGIAGLVDAFDRFDPVTAARAGVDLDRVLWVRGPALTLEGLGSQASGLRKTADHGSFPGARGPRPEACLDRAILNGIRALDLILRAGGFSVAALDLADAPARALAALPFTTWLRLAHANEGRDTVCVIAADRPLARSAHGVSMRLEGRRSWTGTHARSRRFAGFDLQVRVVSAQAAGVEPGPARGFGTR